MLYICQYCKKKKKEFINRNTTWKCPRHALKQLNDYIQIQSSTTGPSYKPHQRKSSSRTLALSTSSIRILSEPRKLHYTTQMSPFKARQKYSPSWHELWNLLVFSRTDEPPSFFSDTWKYFWQAGPHNSLFIASLWLQTSPWQRHAGRHVIISKRLTSRSSAFTLSILMDSG